MSDGKVESPVTLTETLTETEEVKVKVELKEPSPSPPTVSISMFDKCFLVRNKDKFVKTKFSERVHQQNKS